MDVGPLLAVDPKATHLSHRVARAGENGWPYYDGGAQQDEESGRLDPQRYGGSRGPTNSRHGKDVAQAVADASADG